MTGSTIAHIVIGVVAIAAVTVMACYHATISGAEAVTVIVAVLVGSGIIATASLTSNQPTSAPTPPSPPVAG